MVFTSKGIWVAVAVAMLSLTLMPQRVALLANRESITNEATALAVAPNGNYFALATVFPEPAAAALSAAALSVASHVNSDSLRPK